MLVRVHGFRQIRDRGVVRFFQLLRVCEEGECPFQVQPYETYSMPAHASCIKNRNVARWLGCRGAFPFSVQRNPDLTAGPNYAGARSCEMLHNSDTAVVMICHLEDGCRVIFGYTFMV